MEHYPWYKRLWHLGLIIVEPCLEVSDLITDAFVMLYLTDRMAQRDFSIWWEFLLALAAFLVTTVVWSAETLVPLCNRTNPCSYRQHDEVLAQNSDKSIRWWKWSCWFELKIHKKIILNQPLRDEDIKRRKGPCTSCASGRHGALLFLEDIPQLIVAVSVSYKNGAPTGYLTQKIVIGIISGLLRLKGWIFG